MKKIALSVLLILTVLMFQNCKKSSKTDDTPATSYPLLQATVNNVVWSPDTVSATITYNAAAKTKVLSITGTKSQRQVNIAITTTSATNTADFPPTTYTVDVDHNPLMSYAIQQKDTNTGAYVFVSQGIADVAGGTITLTTADAAKKVISGSFNFTTRKITYDNDGNVVSVNASTISGGTFNNMPYTFVSN